MDGTTVGVFVIIAVVTLITLLAVGALLWDRESKQFVGAEEEPDAYSGTREHIASRADPKDEESEMPGLFGWGWMLLVGGIVASIASCFLPVSAPVSLPADNPYIPGLTDVREVINIGLLQRQMMVFEAGLAAFLAGVICLCASAIRDRR